VLGKRGSGLADLDEDAGTCFLETRNAFHNASCAEVHIGTRPLDALENRKSIPRHQYQRLMNSLKCQ
jgi:hypothetical protein